MARRKQREPRKSAAYLSIGLEEASFEDNQLQDASFTLTKYRFNEEEEAKECLRFQDSPNSNDTNMDTGCLSPLSDTSDQIPEFENISPTEELEEEKEEAQTSMDNGLDDSAQTNGIGSDLLSDASWSDIVMNIMKSRVTEPSTAGTTKSSGNYIIGRPANPYRNVLNGKAENGGTGNNCNIKASDGASVVYDWHRAAVAKTLQQTHHRLSAESSLFSTVQLYRQNHKLYSSVLTGASKFKCKDCNCAYDTLVGLTVHMNKTGHYHDDNQEKEEEKNNKHWSKPRKRSLLELEGKEDAQKVLKCMFCGHSFESLQDLSVHMIKTKHYQKVPLKEPVPALATKLVPAAKKRFFHDSLISPCSPKSIARSSKQAAMVPGKGTLNPYVTQNNRYGYQNGASYTWQFEERKAQILKCMECGSSHDTLQQLTAHMMVTGHFLKVTHTALKKGKQLGFDQSAEDITQSIPLPPTPSVVKLQSGSPSYETKKDTEEVDEPMEKKIKVEMEEESMNSTFYKYLKEEDIAETAREGMDILKSLENAVSSAISKAQTGTPTWGGYSSIHAAYQLQGAVKPSIPPPVVQSVQPVINSKLQSHDPDPGSVIYTPTTQSVPLSLRNNVSTINDMMEKFSEETLVRKKREELIESGDGAKSASPFPRDSMFNVDTKANKGICEVEAMEMLVESQNCRLEPGKSPVSDSLCSGSAKDQSPERPFISPLNSLQLVLNTHLPKASTVVRVDDQTDGQNGTLDTDFCEDTDQPIDLRKSKSSSSSTDEEKSLNDVSRPKVINNKANGSHSIVTPSDSLNVQENALMDISDMVKNLTSQLTPKSSTPPSLLGKSDTERSSSSEDLMENLSSTQKQKGRQSNWNPQHLLILQAEFASSLRQTPEGCYIVTDLCPHERVKICKFTGLLMTTVSHWLANVKYQLRRTGGTKFLKNLDSRNPLFLCGECGSKFRTPSAYVNHLESHLGFSLEEMSKMCSR